MSQNSLLDFAINRNILDFKPHIEHVIPDAVEEDKFVPRETISTIDTIKAESTEILSQYSEIEQQLDDLQLQINNRSKDLVIKLDVINDSHVIDAIQRHFNDPLKKEITFSDYLECINHISETTKDNITVVDQSDIESAASDYYRDNFGSLGYPSGLARPELDKQNQSIKPIDLKSFQQDQLDQLFQLFLPKIEAMIKKQLTGGLF